MKVQVKYQPSKTTIQVRKRTLFESIRDRYDHDPLTQIGVSLIEASSPYWRNRMKGCPHPEADRKGICLSCGKKVEPLKIYNPMSKPINKRQL